MPTSGAKIEVWLDFNSFYSRFALSHLRKYSKQLASHGVEYEIHPVFIHGINAGSKNSPPWMHPVKAKHSKFDSARAAKYFGFGKMKPPKTFPVKSLLALRSMCYIKENFPREQYELSFAELWVGLWDQQMDLGEPQLLAEVFKRHFSETQVKEILTAAQEQKYKDKLSANVETVLKHDAFGAPWFWVRNSKGQEEPFFGSDRFHYIWQYLDIPHNDFEVLPKAGAKL